MKLIKLKIEWKNWQQWIETDRWRRKEVEVEREAKLWEAEGETAPNEERRGISTRTRAAEQAYPWAAMRVFVYALKHCKVQQGVVKFIGFVFANIAALNSEMWSAFQLCTTKIRHE